MAEIRRNVKNIQQSGFLLVGVDVSKAKDDACETQCRFVKNEDVLEGVTYLWTTGFLGCHAGFRHAGSLQRLSCKAKS
jgi:hypothetical protein